MRRWLQALLLLIFLAPALAPAPATAQFGGCLPAFCGQTAAPSACAEATTFLARTSGLDTLHRNAYIALICGLVTDGVWAKLDTLYTFATQDQTSANLNLVSTSFTISPQDSISWTADRGYTGVEGSTTKYLFNNLDYSGGTHFSVNNAHIAIWSNSSGQTAGWEAGTVGGFGGEGVVVIISRNTSDDAVYYLNTTTGIGVANTNGLGFYAANMSGGTTLDAYKNGSSVGTATPTVSAPWGGPIPFLARNAFPGLINTGSGIQMSGASEGGTLTSTDHSNLYNRMRTYMTTVGVP